MEKNGIHAEIINIHTIKPLDNEAILASVSKTRCVVTAEEHMMNGGLGDSIAQLLCREIPLPMEMVAVNDQFGQSGKPEELLEKYGLEAANIVKAFRKSSQEKNRDLQGIHSSGILLTGMMPATIVLTIPRQ